MRLTGEMLAFQKRFEDLKNTGHTFLQKNLLCVEFLSYFMFYVTSFSNHSKKKKVEFPSGRWSETLLMFHISSQKTNYLKTLSKDKYNQPRWLKAIQFLH